MATDDLFGHLVERARELSRDAYEDREHALPAVLTGLDYDQYRSIRFRPESALWRGASPFELQLFHPGFTYRERVDLHVVEGGAVRIQPFDPTLFRYDGPAADISGRVPGTAGYAGFRIHYPLNEPSVIDELVAFLGTAYFRLLGPGHVYGLSSRGLAVNIATDLEEEFPVFREFWLERPGPEATSVVFHALLEGPSVVGAYSFLLEPGRPAGRGEDAAAVEPGAMGVATTDLAASDIALTDLAASDTALTDLAPTDVARTGLAMGTPTIMTVDARLFARRDIAKLGVAPMSSMFLFGENRPDGFDDFRPEVHDSDGLMALTGKGEWIWRPLWNGPGLQVTSLRDEDPAGFGLVQRQRDFDRYLDLEANYHRRPSQWVEVLEGDWGSGGVELLVIPTESEFNDNVAAYWVSDEPFRAGDARRYRYRLITFDDRLPGQDLATVARTRVGWDALPGQSNPPPRSTRRVVVDFEAHAGSPSPADVGAPVEPVLEAFSGDVADVAVRVLPRDAGWRVTFQLEPDGGRPADLRLYLEADGRRLTETWSYIWYPDRVR